MDCGEPLDAVFGELPLLCVPVGELLFPLFVGELLFPVLVGELLLLPVLVGELLLPLLVGELLLPVLVGELLLPVLVGELLFELPVLVLRVDAALVVVLEPVKFGTSPSSVPSCVSQTVKYSVPPPQM